MWKWLAFLLDLPALAVLVLPFTFGVSPWAVMVAGISDLWFLALPFFLVFFFITGRLIQLLRRVPGPLAWPFAIASFLTALTPCLYGAGTALLDTVRHGWRSADETLILAVYVLTILASLTLGMLLAIHRSPKVLVAAIVARGMYLANLAFVLLVFYRGWQVGAWLALLAGLLYIVDTTLLTGLAWHAPYLRPDPNLCPTCEYDIRVQLVAAATGTAARCPECGTPIAPTAQEKAPSTTPGA